MCKEASRWVLRALWVAAAAVVLWALPEGFWVVAWVMFLWVGLPAIGLLFLLAPMFSVATSGTRRAPTRPDERQ